MRNLTIWQALAIASQMGFILASTVLVTLGIGYLLDSWLQTRPVFTLVGSLVGLAAGILGIARLARLILRDRPRR